jgi:uncharacterized protein YoxC
MYLEIGLILFGVALLLLVAFCIPILLKLWRAASDVTVTLQALNERLPVILKNMEEIAVNINQSTSAINDQVRKYAETSQRLQVVMHQLVSGVEWLSPLAVRTPVFRKITEAIALVKGARVFLKVLMGK